MSVPEAASAPRTSRLRRLRYVIAMLAVYPLLQVFSAAFYYVELQTPPAGETALRLPNVRLLPFREKGDAFVSYLSRVARKEVKGKDVVLIAGDSQMYGYFLKASDTFGAFLERELGPGVRVVNASKMSGNHIHSLDALKAALAAGLKPKVLVVHVNGAEYRIEGRVNPELPFADDAVFRGLPLALLTDRETSEYFVDMVAHAILAGRWSFDLYDRVSSPPGDGTYQLAAVDANYYPPVMTPYAERDFRTLMGWAEGKVERVIVVASPQYYAPYLAPPYSYPWDISAYVGHAMAVCREYRHAVCLDLSTAFGRESFHDLTHLNRSGHQEFARRIAAAIRDSTR